MTEQESKFTELVREYKNTIYTVCMMFADKPEDTDDLVQEALINLWRGFQKADDVCKSWVWRVSMNSCITIDRKRKKRSSECPLTADMESMMNNCDESDRNNNIKLLYDRIHQLNAFDRAIVMLWLEGMPYEEIGDIVGISTKNVSVRLIRIKEQLKKMNNGK
ncbi:MAG: sigma-70 family RNA polymerase sigma factor [Prevotellaceae bacterium]|nr:sigma-70 family RNA polymerase sigma factor [Prevotellaceae bacterium]